MTQNSEKQERVRFNLELTPAVKERLETVRNRTGAGSLTEVLRNSLKLYDQITERAAKGASIVLELPDGTRERLVLL